MYLLIHGNVKKKNLHVFSCIQQTQTTFYQFIAGHLQINCFVRDAINSEIGVRGGVAHYSYTSFVEKLCAASASDRNSEQR